MSPESASSTAKERACLDEALADNEQLRRIASSFAHDFNNLLAVITGYSELMLRRMRPNDPLRASAESIKKATEWGISLAQQVLAASRRQGPALATVSLNHVVTNVTRVLQPAMGERIEVVTRLDPDAGRVAINHGQLGQVIMNLVVNARDAMPEGGTLTVETERAEAEAVLRVSDTGIGIDAATRARLFEPYFTTKEPGKGMGLGLSTVSDVVSQHGGRIEVTSVPGHGSTFRISLPRLDETPAVKNGAPAAIAGAEAKSATVLVVEDETEVRELIREILQFEKYAILEARDHEEALALSGAHEGAIDLLIADVVLPGTSADELVERIAVARPGIKVLYVSGYLDDAEGAAELRQKGPILQKPFTVAALTRTVREVLEDVT
jgi:CheY-like chemotaxis protein/two-component sensor histidine kinase